jgi:endonuclease IV
MTDARFENIPLVLETPNEDLWEQEIRQLMEMAG